MENENHDQTQDKPLPQMPVEETPLEMQDANFPPLQTNTDSGISASSQRKDIEMTAEVQQLEPIKVLPVKDSSVEEVSSSFKEPMNINDSAAVLSPKKENNVEFRADDAENADEKPSDSFSGKNSTDEVSTIISSNADEWEKTTDLMVEDNQLELYVPPIPSLDEFSDVHKPKEQRRESPVASGNSSMPEFLVQTPSASSSLPNLCASPSGSILKRPKVVDDSNSGESPSSKVSKSKFNSNLALLSVTL